MHSRGTYRPLLALFVALAVLAAGCGGGGSGQSSGGDGSGPKPEKQVKADAGNAAPAPTQTKIALGTISSIDAGGQSMALRSRMGDGATRFGIAPDLAVTIDGKSAELAAVQEGQQAKVEYVVRGDRNLARALDVFGS